jgi:hypothetical protein
MTIWDGRELVSLACGIKVERARVDICPISTTSLDCALVPNSPLVSFDARSQRTALALSLSALSFFVVAFYCIPYQGLLYQPVTLLCANVYGYSFPMAPSTVAAHRQSYLHLHH